MSEPGVERNAVAPVPDEEDLARANLYGLVSRLFYAPADPNLLAEVSRAPAMPQGEEDTALVRAWSVLRDTCRTAYPAIVREEYDGLFIGVGKATVTPYLSAYAEPHSPDRYLVRLREQLAAWGLARREAVFEVEDHVSGVSDVMRWLIVSARPLTEQRGFFEDYVYSGAILLFAAVQKAPNLVFYHQVVSFAWQFLEVEKAAFEMDDAA